MIESYSPTRLPRLSSAQMGYEPASQRTGLSSGVRWERQYGQVLSRCGWETLKKFFRESVIEDKDVIKKILKHLGLWEVSPVLHPKPSDPQ